MRQIKDTVYGSTATDDGYGHHDEDQGQMGALSALMAMGLFEVTGAGLKDPVYDITSPIFDEITIKLDRRYYRGKQFRIVTHGNSADNLYIQRAKLNGKRLDNAWFRHDQLTAGGTLELWMGPKPNHAWGVKQLPPSESASQGRHPVLSTGVAISGAATIDQPYGSTSYAAKVTPTDAALREVTWSVTEPDGSATDKATIDPFSGELTVNHRDGDVAVRATAVDSGKATSTQRVTLALDRDLLRGNAARWPGVTATASSEYDSRYPAEKAIDGVTGSADSGDWASAGEQDPSFQLDWKKPVRADAIVLYDRPGVDDANGGSLTFSDGSSVQVDDIPADGSATTVRFETKTFDSVRFQVTGGSGPNVGLSELEVSAFPDVPGPPQDATAVSGRRSATVSWRAPDSDGGVPITGYVVRPYLSGVAQTPIQAAEKATEITVPGLQTGETYRFTVTAHTMVGSGQESPPSDPVRIQ